MSQKENVGAIRWNKEYASGMRYDSEPPVPFVHTIADIVRTKLGDDVRGLYAGCGNGRNFIPLVEDLGLNLEGIDYAGVAIRQLVKQKPELRGRVDVADYLDYEAENPLDYIVALQVFQHGQLEATKDYFKHTAELLRQGGLLFLRVNSASTEVFHNHTVIEKTTGGGFSVRYSSGPKKICRYTSLVRKSLRMLQ